MSLSIYPRSIPAFRNHRNLLDDVNAEDVNLIQRELTAVAASLGANPQVFTDIALPQVVTEVNPSDAGGVDEELSYTGQAQYYNPESKSVDYGTVANRFNSVERGLNRHCFRLSASGLAVSPSSNMSLSTRPKRVRFPKPNDAQDPFGMYSGSGVRLRKSGFWVLQASITYNRQGGANQNAGLFQATIDRNESWIEGADRQDWTAGGAPLTLNCTLSGFFNRGDKIELRTSHNSAVNQTIRKASLSGFLLREDEGS